MTDTYSELPERNDGPPGRSPGLSELADLTRPLTVNLQAIFDQSPIGIAVCDTEGRLLDANPTCLGICGFHELKEALGIDVFRKLHVSPEGGQALQRGEGVQFETSFVPHRSAPPSSSSPPAIRRAHVHVKISPLLPDQDSPPEAYLVHVEDISARVQVQETYRALVEGSLQGLALFQDGGIVFANRQLAEMTGYSVEELQGMGPQDVSQLIHPEHRAQVTERLRQRLVRQRQAEQYEVRFVREDGQVRWAELSAQAIKYGGRPAVQATYVDVTERKRAQEALEQSERRYRTLFQESPTSLWEEDYSAVKAYVDRLREDGVDDLRGHLERHPESLSECVRLIRVIAVNKATLELYGAASDEELVAGLGAIMSEEAYPALADQLLAIADRRGFPQTNTVNRTLDGERLDLLVDMRVVPGYEETYSRVLVSLLDITERREMEEALKQQDVMTALGQMAAGMAHDFRTLLTTIILHAQMGLRAPGLPSQVTPHLRTIVDVSQQASDLIQQILDFSSSSMLDVQVLDLEEVVSQTLDDLQRDFPGSIDLLLETHSGPFLVRADPERIRQVLTNLALNARDAIAAQETAKGGEIRVALRRVSVDEGDTPPSPGHRPELGPGDWVHLRVSDTGTGMPEEVSEHVFEPFFTTKDVGEGRGLGLAQVYGIVRQHDGVIDFDSTLGEGTTFHIYLRAHQLDHRRERRVSPGIQ